MLVLERSGDPADVVVDVMCGNPAVVDCYAVRPVALRPRLSAGLPLSRKLELDLMSPIGDERF